MTVPTNAQEWWAEWLAIRDDVKGYVDLSLKAHYLAGRMVSMGRPGLGKALKDYATGSETTEQVWDRLTEERRGKLLYRLLHLIWDAAPDSYVIHTWPSWHRFCDLLSEGADMEGVTR